MRSKRSGPVCKHWPVPNDSLRLEVPGVPTPSANEWTNRTRHRWRYRTHQRAWMDLLTPALLAATNAGQWRMTQRVRVTIEVQRRNLLDWDNFLGGLKPVLDALRKLGVIPDDNPGAIEVVARQEVGAPGTVLLLALTGTPLPVPRPRVRKAATRARIPTSAVAGRGYWRRSSRRR